MEISELVKGAVQLSLDILKVTDQVAFNTPPATDSPFVECRDVAGILGRRRRPRLEIARPVLLVQF